VSSPIDFLIYSAAGGPARTPAGSSARRGGRPVIVVNRSHLFARRAGDSAAFASCHKLAIAAVDNLGVSAAANINILSTPAKRHGIAAARQEFLERSGNFLIST
jgi:hypothetical protein